MICDKLHYSICFITLLFLPQICFLQTTFSDKIIIQEPEIFGPTFVSSCDLNGDGYLDVLIASYEDDKISWYPNTDGHGTFGDQQIISSSAFEVPCAIGADLDGDGDIDVLSAGGAADQVVWNRNLFVETVVDEEKIELPKNYQLGQNYPNPFNHETVIQFDVKEKSNVNLTIYNMLGSPLVTIIEDYYQPGSYKVEFDGVGLPSGIYFYRLQADSFTSVRKMVLMD